MVEPSLQRKTPVGHHSFLPHPIDETMMLSHYRRYIFTLRRAENDLSDVALVAGVIGNSLRHTQTAEKDKCSGGKRPDIARTTSASVSSGS